MIGEMWFEDLDGEMWQYELHTSPPEALYWKTYKIKLQDITVISTDPTEVKKRVRKEIYNSILVDELGEKKKGKWWK
tara:strand:- start:700 stop:930 length:231 start_codon:yes stop_codon:yes gene_type:complete